MTEVFPEHTRDAGIVLDQDGLWVFISKELSEKLGNLGSDSLLKANDMLKARVMAFEFKQPK